MKTISRRELFKKTAASLGAVTLGQWLSGFGPTPDFFQSSITPSILPVVPADDLPYLAAATGGSDPEILVRKAVAAIGGMERFVPKGATVIVKPNMCIKAPASQGATTHPVVAAAVVKLALEAGAKKVMVMDFPFQGSSASVYEVCGVGPAVTAAGGEMVPISRIKFVTTQIPKAVKLKQAAIYDDILKAEVLINVPVAKSHSEAGVTLGLKNMMGTVDNRAELHVSLDQCIVDLNTIVHSHLTIIDAIRVMLRGGPTGGSPDYLKDVNTIVASPDIVAADTYALRFFNNKKLENIPYIGMAAQAGLGRCDIENVKIEEITVA
jgi:uncharacterized protein (DUF362 family)